MLKTYTTPDYTLLERQPYYYDSGYSSSLDNSKVIERVFRQYGVGVIFKYMTPTPQYWVYHFNLASIKDTNKIGKILPAVEIALRMDAKQVKTDTTDFALMVSKRERTTVPFTYATYNLSRYYTNPLTAFLGMSVNNKPVFINLETNPHILLAGATGSGKSVALNSILCSLLYTATPLELQLVMIDPKRVELSRYSGLPHLATDIITEVEDAERYLAYLCEVMDSRYDLLSREQVKYIDELTSTRMPHILVVIDEFADLILSRYSDIEDYIVRLAQKGRACGIHLLIATQRPTRDVLRPLIKANMTTRVALKTMSITDSIVILDHKGAEQLNGKGDAIVKLNDKVEEEHIQVAYIQDKEIDTIVSFWKQQL